MKKIIGICFLLTGQFYYSQTSFKGENGKFGFKDENGKILVEPKYESVNNFFQGTAKIKLNGKYGYIDKTGKEIVPPIYDEVGHKFNDIGLVRVKLNNKYGFVDKTGTEVIPCIYEKYNVSDGYAGTEPTMWDDYADVGLNNKTGILDRTGKIIVPIEYENAEKGRDCFIMKKNNEYVVYNLQGEKILEGINKVNQSFLTKCLMVKKSNKYALFAVSGQQLTEFIYDEMLDGGNGFDAGGKGFIRVAIKGSDGKSKWGFLNEKGNAITEIKYDFVYEFQFGNDYAMVTLNNKYGVIDSAGKVIIEPNKYDNIKMDVRQSFVYNGIIGVNIGAKLIPKTKESYEELKGGKWGFVDINGTEIIPFIYDNIEPFKDGKAKVKKGKEEYYIDKNGTKIN
jgi:hypothetical protein